MQIIYLTQAKNKDLFEFLTHIYGISIDKQLEERYTFLDFVLKKLKQLERYNYLFLDLSVIKDQEDQFFSALELIKSYQDIKILIVIDEEHLPWKARLRHLDLVLVSGDEEEVKAQTLNFFNYPKEIQEKVLISEPVIKESTDFLKDKEDTIDSIESLAIEGDRLMAQSHFSLSEKMYLSALEKAEKSQDLAFIQVLSERMGDLLVLQNQSDKACCFYKKAIDVVNKRGDVKVYSKMLPYQRLGQASFLLEKDEEALENYSKAFYIGIKLFKEDIENFDILMTEIGLVLSTYESFGDEKMVKLAVNKKLEFQKILISLEK